MASGSRRAVVTAIVGNGTLTVLKFAVALPTQSAALMNEAVHSLMDTLNQLFLLIGLAQGEKRADGRYAFGHGQKKYLWNCLLYTSPSPRDLSTSRMPSSA